MGLVITNCKILHCIENLCYKIGTIGFVSRIPVIKIAYLHCDACKYKHTGNL